SFNVTTIQDLITSTARQLNEDAGQFGFNLQGDVLSFTAPLDFASLAGVGGFEGLDAHLSGLTVKLALDLGNLPLTGPFTRSRALSVEVLGDGTGINLFDLFTGGAGFAVGRKVVDANVPG